MENQKKKRIWVYVQVSFAFYAEGNRDEIKNVMDQALGIACSHIEASLPHEGVGYNYTQFKTDVEEL